MRAQGKTVIRIPTTGHDLKINLATTVCGTLQHRAAGRFSELNHLKNDRFKMHPDHNTPPRNGPVARDKKGLPKALVAEQKYDRIERYTLETARIFFIAFSEPDTQFWMYAYRYCESAYGAIKGPAIAQATLDMLNAMRTTRPHTFNYTDPRCRDCSEFMTPEERYLMESFRHLRTENKGTAQMNALLLCEGKDPTEFQDAAIRLVKLFPPSVSEQASLHPQINNSQHL